MRITKKVKETIETEQTQDILCNICGLTLSNAVRAGYPREFDFSGLDTIIYGGYDSMRIGDMCALKFSICEHCLMDKIVPMMTIDPEYFLNGVHDFVPLKESAGLLEKHNKEQHESLVGSILSMDSTLDKKGLLAMDDISLTNKYWEVKRRVRDEKK